MKRLLTSKDTSVAPMQVDKFTVKPATLAEPAAAAAPTAPKKYAATLRVNSIPTHAITREKTSKSIVH